MEQDGPSPGEDALRDHLQAALAGSHRVLRLLGRGGMGAVYLAREDALERLVAIKVLPPELGRTSEARERFRREARTAAALSHPNIVPLHGFGETADGLLYLVMGWVPGESLGARVAGGPLDAEEVRRIVAEVADALHYAHRLGVVHRDVKPENVLVDDRTGRALLLDFGVARLAGGAELTQDGVVVGTPRYMAPEQCAGRAADPRSDVYSLGAMAFTLLAGRPPFLGAQAGELIAQHLRTPPPSLADHAPDVPDDLAAAVARCLAKDPAARWPDAASLRDAVAPKGVEQDRLPEPLDFLDGRGPALLPLVALLAFAVWEWWLWREASGLIVRALAIGIGGVIVFRIPLVLSAVAVARGRGFRAREIGGALLRQPAWWPCFWYPPRWRRAADVWPHLPASVRLWRSGITVAVALGMAAAAVLMWAHSPRAHGDAPLQVGLVLLGASLVASLAALAGQAAIARSVLGLGLDVYARRRLARALLTGPTSDRLLWKRPDVAPFVARRTEPRTPGEYVRALPPAARRRGEELATAAEAARSEAVRLDRALGALDLTRLDAQIDALGADPPDEAARQLRRVLGEQRALASRLAVDAEAARARQAAALQALARLWRSPREDEASAAATSTHPDGLPSSDA